MPYYMTFFVDHESDVSLSDIEAGLRAEDARYRVEVFERGPTDSIDAADLYYGSDVYARLEINRPGESLFHGDIQDHVEAVEYDGRGQMSHVIATLRRANSIVRVHVLWGERNRDLTLDRLQPLWDWLFLFRRGVLHADGEGFYDADGLIVELS